MSIVEELIQEIRRSNGFVTRSSVLLFSALLRAHAMNKSHRPSDRGWYWFRENRTHAWRPIEIVMTMGDSMDPCHGLCVYDWSTHKVSPLPEGEYVGPIDPPPTK